MGVATEEQHGVRAGREKPGLCSLVPNRGSETRVVGDIEKNSFITLPGERGPRRRVASKPCLALEGFVRSPTAFKEQGQLVGNLLIGWW